MAILFTDNLVGTPTSGTAVVANHTWASYIGAVSYTASTVNGLRAVSCTGSTGSMRVGMDGVTRRLRFVAQQSGTISAVHYMAVLENAAFTTLADVSMSNTGGLFVRNRWNYAGGGQTGIVWPADTPWRFEYKYTDGVATLLEVWTDPDATGEPTYAITATESPAGAVANVQFGSTSATGLTLLIGGIAMSEGERIGPATAATVPAAVSNLAGTAGNTQVPLTWTAPADGGSAITDYVVQYRIAP